MTEANQTHLFVVFKVQPRYNKIIFIFGRKVVSLKYTAATKKRKQMLADSLKRAISKKSFSKVTVSEIVEDCGINRKTFYYHF